jgi:hypothetical protein
VAAGSPEELETLLEDALLLQDHEAVTALFEDRGVVVSGPGCVSGRTQAAGLLAGRDFVASSGTATVIRGVAVVVGEHAVNLSRRGPDGQWRLVAAILIHPQRSP